MHLRSGYLIGVIVDRRLPNFLWGTQNLVSYPKAQANVQKCENCIARLKDLDELILSYN